MLKRTILVVDDQIINRKILFKLLNREYDILEASNGKEAMDILKKKAAEISAVLLDIVMPVMNGHEVLKTMNEDPVLSKIPVIVSSQKDGDEAEIEALSLGALDFIAKPYKGEIILRRLSNTIKLRETAALINKVEKDELTGLYSKQFFYEHAADELRSNPQKKYDIICVGVERFKLINETFGSEKGDELLRYIAEIIKKSEHFILSSRFSADIFYMLILHRDEYKNEDFAAYIEHINDFPIDMDIKIHCGIYSVTDNDMPVSVMCARAEIAADKNKGKYDAPYCAYDDSLRQKLMEEQFITSNMRTALEERQFYVYYQPKYDLNNELVAGAEALVRWIHPEMGFMSPGSFIPLFERNGFITALDQYVWETACRDIRRWIDCGYPPVSVSVNVSRADIYNPKLTDILLELVSKYKIPIRYLHLEITESAYTDNPEQIIAVVNKLRGLGFIIEMDDFGSGYSSLNMLAEINVNVLKLDMKFIQNETDKISGKGILSFVISLAKWLNLAVVAEGVETAEQISTLRSMDCNYVQGFYFAKPMKCEDFENLLKTTKVTEMICNSQTVHQYVKEKAIRTAEPMGRKILVVDDIELNRAVLASALENEYQIVEKENGAEEFLYLNEHYREIDAILLDLLMPVMDGFQLLDKIRSDDRMKDLPVIITSQGDSGSEQRALRMQADDFISKPYNPDIIKHRVHNVIESHNYKRLKFSRDLLDGDGGNLSSEEHAFALVQTLKPYFDIVRLVEPEHTLVCRNDVLSGCDIHACFAVWGKATRCNNCISLQAMQEKSRTSKLEYSKNGLYFVVSQFVPFGETGAVIEMVTKLEDKYVDNVFDKKMLYAKMDEIHHELEIDELTQIYNRRYIDKHFGQSLFAAREEALDAAVIMVDIDSFKKLNDTYGHLEGDNVLKAIARILSDNVSINKGDFTARFGGDEFLIFCHGVKSGEAESRVENAERIIAGAKILSSSEEKVSISAGIVYQSEFMDAPDTELIDYADKRLYAEKKKKG